MSLEAKLNGDLKTAMLAKDSVKVEVIRAIKTAITVAKSAKSAKSEFEDTDIVQILVKQSKQRKDSIEQFLAAGRNDLADNESKELEYIETLLPKDISEDALRLVVLATISEMDSPNMGSVIKTVKSKVEDQGLKVDGKVLSTLVRENLS